MTTRIYFHIEVGVEEVSNYDITTVPPIIMTRYGNLIN